MMKVTLTRLMDKIKNLRIFLSICSKSRKPLFYSFLSSTSSKIVYDKKGLNLHTLLVNILEGKWIRECYKKLSTFCKNNRLAEISLFSIYSIYLHWLTWHECLRNQFTAQWNDAQNVIISRYEKGSSKKTSVEEGCYSRLL